MTKVKKSLTVLTSTLVALLISTTVFAGGVTRVNEIRISGLDHFRGLMLTAFYVNARPSGFGTAGALPRVREILKASAPVEIHGNGDAAVVPATQIIAEGFKTYNYVYFVVHSPYLEEVGLKNVDGSIPLGQRVNARISADDSQNPFNHRYIFFASRSELSQEADKSTGVINITENPRINNYQAVTE